MNSLRDPMNPTIELLKSHRSIRKFTGEKIPPDLLRELIRAGQCAATSNHVQAYSIIHVINPDSRRKIAELAGGQSYIADCSDFLVFCADMRRSTDAAGRAGADVVRGMTEQLLVATIDTSLMAQNVAIAAESEGKPRLPVEAILREDYYSDARDEELVAGFDRTMNEYYRERTGGNKDTTWSEQLKPLFTSKLRPHMRDFLRKCGFEMK